MPEPLSARIRAYSGRDEKEVRFMIGQAHMEPLAYANQQCEISLLPSCCSRRLTRFPSVLSPVDSRCVDCFFFHVRPLHELVAKLRVRDLELVEGIASVFRLGGACHVLHRLVCIEPPLHPT